MLMEGIDWRHSKHLLNSLTMLYKTVNPVTCLSMENTLPNDIEQLQRLIAEQEALNSVLQAKLEEREREIDRLLSQLYKLRQPVRKNKSSHRADRDSTEGATSGK